MYTEYANCILWKRKSSVFFHVYLSTRKVWEKLITVVLSAMIEGDFFSLILYPFIPLSLEPHELIIHRETYSHKSTYPRVIFHNVWETRDTGAKSAEVQFTACVSHSRGTRLMARVFLAFSHSHLGQVFPLIFHPWRAHTGLCFWLMPACPLCRFSPGEYSSLARALSPWPKWSSEPGQNERVLNRRLGKAGGRGGQSRPTGRSRQPSVCDGLPRTRARAGRTTGMGAEVQRAKPLRLAPDGTEAGVQVSAWRSSWARRTEFSFQKRQAHTCLCQNGAIAFPLDWRRLLRLPCTARRCNQSILKETSSGRSLEGLMLKLQYFGHLMRKEDSLEKTLLLGKIESGRRQLQRMR